MGEVKVLASGTVGALLAQGESLLARSGVPEAAANAEFLMAASLGCGRLEARATPDRRATPKQSNHFLHLVKQRGRRVPLAYILGSQPFSGLDIKVTPAALIPRPETEELVELVAAAARKSFRPEAPIHILEIGTGTGCISIALAAALPSAILYATEISPAAMQLAEENARTHRLEGRIRFLREDLFKPGRAGGGPWADVLVSNPPYIPTGELARLEPEVLKEPFLALDGGKDGLDAIRAIAHDAPSRLKPGGWLALEIGAGQAPAVREILAPLGRLEFHDDFAGHQRFALAQMIE